MNKRILMSGPDLGTLKTVVIALALSLNVSALIQYPLYATTASQVEGVGGGKDQPNINASSVYDKHSMVLGNNIKNLVILIPNEAHESTNQDKNQYPLANQPYLPQNVVVNVGTAVTWFNGDVDHDHKITLSNESASTGSESGDFAYNTASRPITFNDTGTIDYFETDVNSDDPSFVMNGTLNVVDQASSLAGGTDAAAAGNPDTVGTFMVPAKDLDQYVSTLTSKGFTIDSTHTFQDLRGGQGDTGPEQTLIAWTTSGMNLQQVVSALEEITPSLPYS
jgi:plastocyanin